MEDLVCFRDSLKVFRKRFKFKSNSLSFLLATFLKVEHSHDALVDAKNLKLLVELVAQKEGLTVDEFTSVA